MDNLRNMQANRSAVKDTSAPGVSVQQPIIPSFGPNFQPLPYSDHPAKPVKDDWLGRPYQRFDNPYVGDEGGFREHPTVIGIGAALLTLVGAILFAGSFIWLSADSGEDGSDFHTTLGCHDRS